MAGGSYNHIHIVVVFCQLYSRKIQDQTLALPTDKGIKKRRKKALTNPTMAISTLTLTTSIHTRSFRPTISSSSSSSFSCLCSSSPIDFQQKQRSFTAGKKNVFGVGLGILAATILSLTPLDADATRIEYYATVGDPLCEYSYAKSGLGFCDIAVGFGDKAPRGVLVNVIHPSLCKGFITFHVYH